MIIEEGQRLRRWVLAITVAGIPLFFLRSTNDPFNVPKLGLLIGGVALATSLRIAESLQGASTRGLARLAFPGAAIALPLLISWVLSPYRYWSLFGEYGRFQGLLPYLLVILLGVLVADAFAEDLRLLARAVSFAGGVAGAYAVIQFVGLDPFAWEFLGTLTETSTLGNLNFAGGFLAMSLPIAVALWHAEDGETRQVWQVVFIAAGLLVSFSQGPYAAAIAGGAIFAGFYFSDRAGWAKRLGVLVTCGVVVAVVGAVGYAMANPDSARVPGTTAQRALWWRGALAMAADHPLTGMGPNSYAVEGPRYRPVDDAAVHGLDFSNDPHSVPLAFLTGAGALGLLGYTGVAVWVAYRARSVDRSNVLQVGFLASVVVYFVQSLVSIDEIALRSTFWAVLGGLAASLHAVRKGASKKVHNAATSPGARKRTRPRLETPRFLPALLLIGAAGIAAVWWGAAFVFNDARVRWGTEAFAAGQPQQGQRHFDRALGFRGEYEYRHLNGFSAGDVAVEQGEAGQAWFAQTRRAYSYLEGFPHVPALVDYARFLLAYSEFDPGLRGEAAEVYMQVTRMDPNNVRLLDEAADALEELGHVAAAAELRARSGSLKALVGQ